LARNRWPGSLECTDELAVVADIIGDSASYQRQRRVTEADHGDLHAVINALVAELDA
jgi:carboxylate-amine ligase